MAAKVGALVRALAAAALVVAAATPAAAQPGPPKVDKTDKTADKAADKADPAVAEAREHFNRAQVLYDEGHPDAALLELRRAYQVKPNFRLLYNIGELSFTTHDYVGALRSFEGYLKEGGADVERAKRAEAESKLVTLRVLVGTVRVRANVPGAALSVDDEPIWQSPLDAAWMVNAGKHRISATKEGYLPASVVVAVLGGEEAAADVRLAPVVPVGASGARPEPAPQAPSRFTTLSWIGIGAAGALTIGAVGFGVASIGARSDLKNITFAGATPSQAYTDTQDKADRDRVVAFVLAGAAVATLAPTLVLTLTKSNATGARVQAALSPGGIILRGGF